jgi:CBS domain-containing protein
LFIEGDRTNNQPVVWSRGSGCRELAEVLAGDAAVRVDSDPVDTCIRTGATLMVSRRLSSFDLCSVAIPSGFSAEAITGVVAAVGSGPHSSLAAAVAERIGQSLAVSARAVYAHGGSEPTEAAARIVQELDEKFPDLSIGAIGAVSPEAMVQELPAGTLLVVGAPGGSWFQRQFFGPGARIKHGASGGTIVVKAAPTRVYQAMGPPAAFGPQMRVADARVVAAGDVVVALESTLLGVVSAAALNAADPETELGGLAQDAAFLAPEETIEHALDLVDDTDGTAIPVVDGSGNLIGVYRSGTGDSTGLRWG